MEKIQLKIVDGYIDLLLKSNGTKITATKLCSFCGIHRSTFYRYFEGIEDLDEKFLFILFASRDCANDIRPQSVPKMIDYLAAIVSVMKAHASFFMISEERSHLLKYRACWSSIVCSEILSWWPKKRYARRNPLLDIRLNLSARLIDSFLDFSLSYKDDNVRAISFILIEYVIGGRLRVLAKSKYIYRESDDVIEKLSREENALVNAADKKNS